jgi:hypothetical protein
MNFNLKHLIFSTVAIIFVTGNAVVADTQLRGGAGGGSGGDTRILSDGGDASHEVASSSEVDGPDSGAIEQLDLLPVDELDWSANASDFTVVAESFEGYNEVDSLESYQSNQANGWGNNCPVPRNNPVGTSCRSFVPHPDNRPEAIFQCRYPNYFSNRDVLYFQCTNANRNPQWTYKIRNY